MLKKWLVEQIELSEGRGCPVQDELYKIESKEEENEEPN